MQKKNKKQINLNYKKKQLIILLAILLCSMSFVIVFGRYVTNSINDFFLRSKEFYFYSDKLSDGRSVFQVEYWSGVDDYEIIVNMNSRKNNIQVASYDISYDISYTCSSNAICQLSKTSGVISKDTNADSFSLIVTPNTQLETGDKVTVEIKATSTSNYKKTIKGKFTLVVGHEDLTYQITDEIDNPYLDVRITNTLSYYVVNEAFGEYPKGYKFDIDTYLALSDENKAKCYSSMVEIAFDPKEVLVDITNKNYQKATNVITTTVDGKSYISGFSLPIEAISSADLRFYKIDVSKDYTYPNSNNYSVVSVTPK